jgi:hypothetical protein
MDRREYSNFISKLIHVLQMAKDICFGYVLKQYVQLFRSIAGPQLRMI